MSNPLAHVLAPPGGHQGLLWVTSILLFGGVVARLLWPHGSRGRTGTVAATAGLIASVAVYATEPTMPQRPDYTLGIVAGVPSGATVAVTACGTTPGHQPVATPGGDRSVVIVADGRAVAEGAVPTLLVSLGPGPHRIQAEVVAAGHIRFQPPLTSPELVVTVPDPKTSATTPSGSRAAAVRNEGPAFPRCATG